WFLKQRSTRPQHLFQCFIKSKKGALKDTLAILFGSKSKSELKTCINAKRMPGAKSGRNSGHSIFLVQHIYDVGGKGDMVVEFITSTKVQNEVGGHFF